VLEATSAENALEVSESHSGAIHLMLTDAVMPGQSGPELARQLGPARPDMKVLFMSGYTDDAIVRHGLLHSSQAFLQKPFSPEVLTGKVREVLDSARG
jgi:two-component system cell cycle sensor histidine kinase/response regulator CckA